MNDNKESTANRSFAVEDELRYKQLRYQIIRNIPRKINLTDYWHFHSLLLLLPEKAYTRSMFHVKHIPRT